MKTLYSFLLTGFFYLGLFSQVGINTETPDPSSTLEIYSNNMGISFPNINLLSKNDTSIINNPKESLMVYNTNNNLLEKKGYYFWNGSQWIKLQTSAEEKWTRNPLTGRMYPTTISDNIGIGTTSPFQKFDVQGGNARINNVFIGDVGFGSLWAEHLSYHAVQ